MEGERFIELPQHERLVGRLRVHQVHHLHVTLRHADDHVGLGGQFGGQHLAALGGDIDPQILHGSDGVFRWRLAVLCAYTGRFHGEIGVIFLDQITKQALSHRAAADVSGADEQNGMAHTRGR